MSLPKTKDQSRVGILVGYSVRTEKNARTFIYTVKIIYTRTYLDIYILKQNQFVTGIRVDHSKVVKFLRKSSNYLTISFCART